MYAISAQTFNVGVQKLPLLKDFTLDLAELENVSQSENIPKVIFLCSPNNPTGTRLPANQIQRVLELFAGKSLVVVDEAYIEFDIEHNKTGLLDSHKNAVILRTLSKAYALAGIRCGFTLASSEIIKVLMKVIAPYPVSDPVAQNCGDCIKYQRHCHDAVSGELSARRTNMVSNAISQCPGYDPGRAPVCELPVIPNRTEKNLMDFLVANGMLIRDQSKQLYLENCLRITVGNREENQKSSDPDPTILPRRKSGLSSPSAQRES